MLRFFAGCIAGLAVAPDAFGDDKQPKDGLTLIGTYDCEGTNPGGTKYKGTVVITRKGDAYLVSWKVGASSYSGIGLVTGKVLSSSWLLKVNNTVIQGVAVYRIEKNKLIGKWTQLPGPGKTYRETLTLRKRPDV